jgi:hypothetical protein
VWCVVGDCLEKSGVMSPEDGEITAPKHAEFMYKIVHINYRIVYLSVLGELFTSRSLTSVTNVDVSLVKRQMRLQFLLNI